jgi:hypothetical protein
VTALAQINGLALTNRVADIGAIRARFGERTPALVETTLLRRKAQAKLPGLRDWLFTDEALQQATAGPVAQHRATRLTGRVVHDVTCSVGTELAYLQATAAAVLGSDIDRIRLAMARHNLGFDASAPLLCRADALAPITADTVVIADPARRSAGRRRFDPRDYRPGLDELFAVYRGRDLVVKCAPGIDFGALPAMGFHGEVEVISWGSSVREACLWSAGLAEPGITRRATILDTGEQLTDADPDDIAVAGPGRWIIDPDNAVVRAGLVRHYGARYGLWQLDPAIAYLSGDRLPGGVRGFEVLDRVPFHQKRLRAALRALDCGPLEILVRGVAVDPDVLRRRLHLDGSSALTVVITRLGSGSRAVAVAFICRASRGLSR